MSADGGLSMEETIAAGRLKYQAQRYRQALDSFTDAIKLCPCEIEKRKRKRRDSVSEEPDGTQADQAATISPVVECDNPLHLQALDYRAGTFEKMTDFRRAHADTRRMMDVAPCSPKGYLRSSKIFRLQEDPDNSLKILTDGIRVFMERGSFQVEDLRLLDQARNPLKLKFGKFDPLGEFVSLSWMTKTRLPLELLRAIFGYFDLPTLCKCLHVSKTWRKTLTAPACALLWRSLAFTGAALPKKPFSYHTMLKILSYSMNDVREFTVENGRKFGLDQRKFSALLGAGRNLERLEVTRPYEALVLTRVPRNLKYLLLDGFHRHHRTNNTGMDVYQSFLLNVADSLERLILVGLPRQWFTEGAMPIMMNLKHLKLVGAREQPWSLEILPLLRNIPKLEQLHIEDIVLEHVSTDPEPVDNCCVPNLKSLTIICRKPSMSSRDGNFWIEQLTDATPEVYRYLAALNAGKKLKALDIHWSWDYNNRQVDEDIFGDLAQGDEYENLEILRLHNTIISPVVAERIFGSAVRQGKLHSFDIAFPLPTLREMQGKASTEHLRAYKWLEGARSIRRLSLYEFQMKPHLDPLDNPVVQFLQTFPCLEEVKLESEVAGPPDFLMTVQDVLNTVKLKTLYATPLWGGALDKVRQLAADRGVKFIYEKESIKWPIDFKDD